MQRENLRELFDIDLQNIKLVARSGLGLGFGLGLGLGLGLGWQPEPGNPNPNPHRNRNRNPKPKPNPNPAARVADRLDPATEAVGANWKGIADTSGEVCKG